MGLFSKKESCAICGGKLGLTHYNLLDGKVCGKCVNNTTQWLDLPGSRTVEDIQRNIAEAQENRKLYQTADLKNCSCGLFVDFQSKLFCVKTMTADVKDVPGKKAAYLFSFDDLIDYEVDKDGTTIQKSGAAQAIAGGLPFGGVGMVAGGLMGRKSKETITKMDLILLVRSEWVQKIPLHIISQETKKGSVTYKLAESTFANLTKVLDTIQARK